MKSRFPSLDAALTGPTRVNVLFSSFRSKALNPDHYEQKMKFWEQTIEEYTTIDKKICLTINELENTFVGENNQKATCLTEVITNLIRTGKAMRRDDFLSSLPTSPENSTWLSWSLTKVQLAARKIWSYSPGNFYKTIDKDDRIVYIPQLQLQEKLLENISTLRDKVMSLEDWFSAVKIQTGLTENWDLILLAEYLRARKKLLFDTLGQTEIVKLVIPSSKVKNVPQISQVEKGHYDIRRTIEILEKDLDNLFEKQQQAEEQARIALREGKRNKAKSYIRARKLNEKKTEKLTAILDNLVAISVQVEDAASDARILAAYETGKKILDKVLEENGLSTDRITEAMLNVQDALELQDEISTSLSQPLVDEDMEELEKALEQLLVEEKNIHEKNKKACEKVDHEKDYIPDDEEKVLAKLDKLDIVDDSLKDISQKLDPTALTSS